MTADFDAAAVRRGAVYDCAGVGVAKFPTPFSFISWDECYRSGYDRFCQELSEWSNYLDELYPPRTPFARLPKPIAYEPDSGASQYWRPGFVSVWLLHSHDARDYFLCDYDCEFEPLDSPPFWEDLGFIFMPNNYSLATVTEPLPIEQLLRQFSTPHEKYGYTDVANLGSFADGILEACCLKSISHSHGLFCAFDFGYCGTPVFGRFCFGLVEYLGEFSYERCAKKRAT